MQQIKAELIFNKQIKHNYFHCSLHAPRIARSALPGQFVNIKLSETSDPLLRRPFSIHKVKGSAIEIIYEVVGKGSSMLSQKKSKELLDIIGPLGNSFSIIDTPCSILVAGGMGVAPLMFLAKKLSKPKTLILIGAKTKKQLLCEEEFKKLGCEVKIATDDGSKGFHGRATELLRKVLRAPSTGQQAASIYACGPHPMLKALADISRNYTIPAQISLEEHMSCGIGACLGCVVDTKQGFKRVCKEGPVFKAEEIIW
jgi:dihydroorotate dehydrogenase electron transfer subunit